MANYTRTPERELPLNPRLPLIGIPNQRGQLVQEDSRLINGYAEQGLDGRWHVHKRPGIEVAWDHSGGSISTISGRGLFTDSVGIVAIWQFPLSTPTTAWREFNVYRNASIVGSLGSYDGGGASKQDGHFGATLVYAGPEEYKLFMTNGRIDCATLSDDGVLHLFPYRGSGSSSYATNTTNGSPIIEVASTTNLRKYTLVTGAGIPANTQILSVDSATQLTLTNNATATAVGVMLTYEFAGPPNRDGISASGGFAVQQVTPSVASLNKSTYLVTARSEIGGSDVEDPTAWDPLNSIFAYSAAESAVAIAVQLSTIVVFKETTLEFFRDTGATPAPLGRVEGLRLDAGLQDANTLCEADDTLIWSARQKVGQRSVWAMTKLQAREVSNPAVRRILTGWQDLDQYGMVFALGGHTFYLIAVADEPALVYDLTAGLWYYWTALGLSYWPFVDAATGEDGTVYLQHGTNGKVYKFNESLYADVGLPIDMDIYPPTFDGGMRKNKYLARMTVNGTQVAGSELKLRVSDDDQQQWTNWRLFDLSHQRPWIEQCGTFTKRNFHFRHSAPTPCVLHEVELEIQPGTV